MWINPDLYRSLRIARDGAEGGCIHKFQSNFIVFTVVFCEDWTESQWYWLGTSVSPMGDQLGFLWLAGLIAQHGAKILKSENNQYSHHKAWEISQPYQEISTFWGDSCLDHDISNSPEQFQIICLLPLASLGLITQIYLYLFFNPWGIDTYSPVGLLEGPDLAMAEKMKNVCSKLFWIRYRNKYSCICIFNNGMDHFPHIRPILHFHSIYNLDCHKFIWKWVLQFNQLFSLNSALANFNQCLFNLKSFAEMRISIFPSPCHLPFVNLHQILLWLPVFRGEKPELFNHLWYKSLCTFSSCTHEEWTSLSNKSSFVWFSLILFVRHRKVRTQVRWEPQ